MSSENFRIWFRHPGQDPVDMEDVCRAKTKSYTLSEVKTQVGSYQLTHLKLEETIPKNIGEIASHAVCLVLRKITDMESLHNLSQLTQLKMLEIDNIPLNTVPDVVSSLTSLEMLNIKRCNISRLPQSLGKLTQLEKLDIGWNPLNTVPDVVSSLTSLKQLIIWRCGISSLPESFCQLTQLEILDIHSNPLNTLPDVVSSLTSLEQLKMCSCGISSLPESLCQLTKLKILDIHSNPLNTVPDVVSSLTSLKQLNMSRCRISSLPESICQLTQLEILDMYNNTLNTVPDIVSSLTSLKQLDINQCGISSLPESLLALTQLEKLNIGWNTLNTVPDVVSSLTSLKQLNMSKCNISSLPESIVNLFNLKSLNSSYNEITCLPDNFNQLSSLKHLDLFGNDNLKVLTPVIADMPLLTHIDTKGCESLTSPPYEVCQQGAGAIKQYYTDIRNNDSIEVFMVTVAVIGQTMSGKTSLIKTLQSTDRTRVLTHRVDDGLDDDTTPVFRMEDVCVDDDVLRFIDFGGHEIYQSIYQFTLKPNCIPIVVVSLEQYEALQYDIGGNEAVRRLYFDWLSHLYLTYPKLGPLKLVLTHLDKIDESELEKIEENFFYHTKHVFEMISRNEKSKWKAEGAFAKIKLFQRENMFRAEDIYKVGNVYCEAFILLKERLLRESKQFVKAMPTTWVEVEKALKKFNKGYMSFQNTFSQFSSSISLTEKQLDIILTYMHNCGMLLWYKHDKDLRPYIFYHIPTVTSLLQVLFTHDDTVWQRRLLAFENPSCDFQQFLTVDEYGKLAEKFASTGVMHGELFKHLLATETDFKENAAMRVAAKILQSFRIMYHSKLQDEENSFIMPYFGKKILSDSLPNTGSCVTFHAQLRFEGLPLPQYAYHQLAVDMLNSFSQDSDSITARNNGARVVNKDVTYQLVHDYKSGIVNIRVSFDSSQVCRAWKVLVDITNSSIKYIETRWRACKIGCRFFCPHCGLEKDPHPSRLMNPSWVQYHGKREKFPLHSSETKHFTCKKDLSAPECLLNPTNSLSEGQKEDLSNFLGKYKKDIPEIETQVESDAENDLSDHEDFFLLGEDHRIKMEVSVTRREEIKQLFYSNQVYRMSETVRGRALIINNNVFSGYPQLERTGSAVDVANTLAVLRELDFEVDVKQDRTAEQIMKDIKDETQRPDHEDYGMHITVLMSHGATYGAYGMLYGTDLKLVKLLDVFDLLSSENFNHMAGKPKVVIVVACRNETVEDQLEESSEGQENQDGGQQTENKRMNFNIDDMLILQSCFDGRKSIRDANYGSPFIRELVKTLYKHSSHIDLVSLFDIVQERVKKVTKKLAEKHSHMTQQVPVVTKTLTGLRKVLLFPKYKVCPDAE